MDAFELVSVPKYNVSLLGLRSLQNSKAHVCCYNEKVNNVDNCRSVHVTFTMPHILCMCGKAFCQDLKSATGPAQMNLTI